MTTRQDESETGQPEKPPEEPVVPEAEKSAGPSATEEPEDPLNKVQQLPLDTSNVTVVVPSDEDTMTSKKEGEAGDATEVINEVFENPGEKDLGSVVSALSKAAVKRQAKERAITGIRKSLGIDGRPSTGTTPRTTPGGTPAGTPNGTPKRKPSGSPEKSAAAKSSKRDENEEEKEEQYVSFET